MLLNAFRAPIIVTNVIQLDILAVPAVAVIMKTQETALNALIIVLIAQMLLHAPVAIQDGI